MRGFNKITLVGNLSADPEVSSFEGGKLAKFSVAVNRNAKSEDGKLKRVADFHRVIAWRGLADVSEKFLKKGSPILVEGRLVNSVFEKDGRKIRKSEVHAGELMFLDTKKNEFNVVEVQS